MRIIVVEDEAPIREGMSKILKKIDPSYELAGKASNGIEGLAMAEKLRPDLVIMDIRMPDMDGLTMLSKIREKKINCKALVLTAYSDFNYAKQAIELGIENYILKPIKIPELKKVLKQIEENILKEQRGEQIYQLPNLFRSALAGQLSVDDQLDKALKERYGFGADAEICLFAVWLGRNFEKYKADMRQMLQEVEDHAKDFKGELLEVSHREVLVIVIYQFKDEKETAKHFSQAVIPMIAGNFIGPLIFEWGVSAGIADMHGTIREMRESKDWSLVFGRECMITKSEITRIETVPLKYPMELETQVRQAIIRRDKTEFGKCFVLFQERCREHPHRPEEIKEACIRYCFAVLNTAKEYSGAGEEVWAQKMFKTITAAVSWEEISLALSQYFDQVVEKMEDTGDKKLSAMVQRAQTMIQEYYNQGITLEEIARKMSVSEEYMSTQFKKETGSSFTETIRRVRIEKIKELLLESNLKLTQIADMVGYADPKYMSKVFREEVGMLPAEYRKLNK